MTNLKILNPSQIVIELLNGIITIDNMQLLIIIIYINIIEF